MVKRKEESKEQVNRRQYVETEEERGRFQLITKGKHYLHADPLSEIEGKKHQRVAEQGDVIVCPPYKLQPFMDKFKRLDAQPCVDAPVKEEVADVKIEHRGGGKYNVIKDGQKINDTFLTKEQAEELAAAYD